MSKSIIAIAAVSLLLAGCGDKDKSTTVQETSETPSIMDKAMESSKQAVESTKETVQESATAVGEATGEAVEAAGEMIDEAADSTMEDASGMKEKAGEMVEEAIEKVKGMAGEATEESAADAAASKTGDVVKDAGSMIGQ